MQHATSSAAENARTLAALLQNQPSSSRGLVKEFTDVLTSMTHGGNDNEIRNILKQDETLAQSYIDIMDEVCLF